MIIGHGDIASVLKDRKDRTYFASGVSNSSEKRESEYQREIHLLLKQDKSRHLVYFSSLSVYYADTRYVRHKMHMEDLVRKNFPRYTILRMGNITWGDNPHTLINFFRIQVKKKEPLKIQNTCRYILSKKEFLHWIDLIPDWNCEMNITGTMMTVRQVAETYVYDR
jgi:hypothetical protein